MTGIKDGEGPAGPEAERETRMMTEPPQAEAGMSGRVFQSLTLILIGVSVGVFWREVFQLTIKMIDTLT